MWIGSGSIHFNSDLDPDPAPRQGDANLRPLALQTLQASILSLHASHFERPSALHFEPRKLLTFVFNADPDPEPAIPYDFRCLAFTFLGKFFHFLFSYRQIFYLF
jgi:hypothetical protein